MPRPTLLVAAGAALLLAVPASASAVTATLNQSCYMRVPTRGSEPVVIALSGGTPNANYLVAATIPGKGIGSAGSVSGTFDATGSATATITDISMPGGSITPSKGRKVDLSIKDYGAGAVETPIGSTLVTTLSMDIATKPKNIRLRREVSVSGTPFANQALSAFVVKGSSSKVLRRIPLGKANGCGYVSKKAIVAPKTYKIGSYRLYVNAGKTLTKTKAIYSTFSIYSLGF
jgi:hypothetical protein